METWRRGPTAGSSTTGWAAHNLSVGQEATANLAKALRWAAYPQAKAPGGLSNRRGQVLLERQQTAKRQAQRMAGGAGNQNSTRPGR